jgi:hypothetical protein
VSLREAELWSLDLPTYQNMSNRGRYDALAHAWSEETKSRSLLQKSKQERCETRAIDAGSNPIDRSEIHRCMQHRPCRNRDDGSRETRFIIRT